jgi:hypothetical protein
MDILEFTTAAAAEGAIVSIRHNLKPDFTRAQFSSNARIHTESRCNHCGFRIHDSTPDTFDLEEQEHAFACRGSEAE